MKNLSIFGNFLKSFVFIFLTLGVLSSEVFGVGCDDSLDNNLITNTANSVNLTANMVIIPDLDGATGDVTKCISGTSTNNETQYLAHDYYKFTVKTAGTLKITTSSPNGKQFHFYVGKNGSTEYRDTIAITHNVPDINLTVDDYIIVWAKETGIDIFPDQYQINFNFVKTDLSQNNELDFYPIHTSNAYSKMRILGNTSLCKKGSRRTTGDGNSVFGCDPSGAGASITNNNVDMINNDYDDVRGISGNGDTTINSSAALLDMPANKKVLWAGLFWQGKLVESDDAKKETVKNVKFKHQDETSYTDLVSQKTNWISKEISFTPTNNPNYDYFVYQGFYDVTEQVKNNGRGYYWVGDIISVEGDDRTIAGGSYAGWSLTVVYEDEDEKMRNTTVYHGYKEVTQGSPVSTTLTGFLTPKDGNVSSELFIFASDGDTGATWSSTLESITVTDKGNTEHKLYNTLNPDGNLFNSTITRDGATVTSGLPYSSPNSLGIDIDSYDVGTNKYIENAQTETTIKIASENSDGFYLGTLALETELYVPNLCYDYAYSQNNVFLTELNYGASDPRLISRTGRFSTAYPIDVKFYIRNKEKSDLVTSNTKFYLIDINTSAAPYVANSTMITPPSQNTPYAFNYLNPQDGSQGPQDYVDANNSLSTHDYQIMNVWNGIIDSEEFFYVYFQLDPQVADINMSLTAEIQYAVKIPGTNQSIDMEYPIRLNDKVPICAENPFVYTPQKGIFNVVHDAYWTPSNTNFTAGLTANNNGRTFNLPTQVVQRNGNFHIISLDENESLGTQQYNTLKSTQTVVGVEIVDAGGWADSTTTCTDSNVSRSSIVWIPIMGNTNSALDDGVITTALNKVGDTEGFFNRAIESAAFRVSYQVVDGNNTMLEITGSAANGGDWNVNNFPDMAGTDCLGDPTPNNPNDNNKVGQWCGNASSSNGINNDKLAQCMQCINGLNTKRVCSRDDFAIRPEAFLLEVTDMNQSTGLTASNEIIGGDDGLATTQLAAGYNYSLRATATTHIDNNGSVNYFKDFVMNDYNVSNANKLSYTWTEPTSVNCNDENSTHGAVSSFGFDSLTGIGERNTSMSQVGIYTLSMYDSTWTKADTDFTTANNAHGPTKWQDNKFVNPNIVKDCIVGDSTSQPTASSTLNGCDISSANNNPSNSLDFVNQTYQFNPYKFGVTNTVTLGLNDRPYVVSTPPSSSNFVYMNNIATPADENMSVHFNTNIIAQGFNDTSLTNFVTGCYAKPVDINLSKSDTNNTALIQRYIVHDLNSTATVAGVIAAGLNADTNIITPNTYFIKAMNGVVNTRMNINYDRNGTAQNPEDISFTTVTVSDPRTNLNADMILTMHAKGENNATIGQANTVINHFYGRTAAKKTRIVCNTNLTSCSSGANNGGVRDEPDVLIYYELYCMGTTNGKVCDKSLIPKSGTGATARVVQKVDSRWFTNIAHVEANDGNLTFTQGNTPATALAPVSVPTISSANTFTKDSTHTYNMSQGLPYTAEMNSTVSPWFIYEDGKTTAQARNKHIVIFTPEAEWSGENESNSTTKTDRVRRINRRTMW